MNLIGNKQKTVRQFGQKIKQGAQIGLQGASILGKGISSGARQAEVIRRKVENATSMLDRNITKFKPIIDASPLGTIPLFNQGSALAQLGLKEANSLLGSSDAKALIGDVKKVGKGIEKISNRQLEKINQTPNFV